MTQPKDGEGAEEAIARIIDPSGWSPDFAKSWGEDTAELCRSEALTKARAILALAPPATPVRGGGDQELSVSQSQPCGEASADAEVFAGLDAEPSAAGKP